MNGLKATITTKQRIGGTLSKPKTVVDSNYELLENKPSINGFTVEGDKSFEDYGLIFDGKTITEKDGKLSVADNSHGHTVENVDGLEDILGAKADKKSLSDHKEDESNPHKVTKEQVGLLNVENKSSEDIRGELTKENVTDALGYTPPTENTTYDKATASSDGLMASGDKSKLDGIAAGANKYVHPAHTAESSGLYKITVDGEGHVSAVTEVTKADITALGIPAQDTNTTYSAATQSAAGLMSAADKKKLDSAVSASSVAAVSGMVRQQRCPSDWFKYL